MTKINEPKSLTRKQFEHTTWFLHHIHAHNLIDHPLLITLLQHAGVTYGAGATTFPPAPPFLTEQGTYGSAVGAYDGFAGTPATPPFPETKPKRAYKKKSVAGDAKEDELERKENVVSPTVKPKRTYKKKVVAEVPSVAGATYGFPPLDRGAVRCAEGAIPPSLTENAKEDEPERKGVVGGNVVSPTVKPKRVYKKKVVAAAGDVHQDKPERNGVCPINDLIKNVLLQQGQPTVSPCLTAERSDAPKALYPLPLSDILVEEPLIIVHPAERKGVAGVPTQSAIYAKGVRNLGSPCFVHPCAGGGYSDQNNNIYHF